MEKPQNHILVIFGASGDLTKRKLIPALFDLYKQKLLPEKFAVLGASRTKMTDAAFRNIADDFIENDQETDEFKKLLYYESVSAAVENDFETLKNRLAELEKDFGITSNYISYLSTPPTV